MLKWMSCSTFPDFKTHLIPKMRVDFSTRLGSSQLNRIILLTGLHVILNGKEYSVLDVIHSLLFGNEDPWIGFLHVAPLDKTNIQFTELRNRSLA